MDPFHASKIPGNNSVVISRHDQHRQLRMHPPSIVGQLQSIHPRHLQIRDHQIRSLKIPAKGFDCQHSVGEIANRVACAFQAHRQCPARHVLIFRKEDEWLRGKWDHPWSLSSIMSARHTKKGASLRRLPYPSKDRFCQVKDLRSGRCFQPCVQRRSPCRPSRRPPWGPRRSPRNAGAGPRHQTAP
jgi:hypothetical protein